MAAATRGQAERSAPPADETDSDLIRFWPDEFRTAGHSVTEIDPYRATGSLLEALEGIHQASYTLVRVIHTMLFK